MGPTGSSIVNQVVPSTSQREDYKITTADSGSENSKISKIIIWLAPLAGKMNRILHSDWPPDPSGQDGAILPARDYPLCPASKKIPRRPLNPFSVKMARYWLRSCFATLWTSTPSRSIHMQKKKLGQYINI